MSSTFVPASLSGSRLPVPCLTVLLVAATLCGPASAGPDERNSDWYWVLARWQQDPSGTVLHSEHRPLRPAIVVHASNGWVTDDLTGSSDLPSAFAQGSGRHKADKATVFWMHRHADWPARLPGRVFLWLVDLGTDKSESKGHGPIWKMKMCDHHLSSRVNRIVIAQATKREAESWFKEESGWAAIKKAVREKGEELKRVNKGESLEKWQLPLGGKNPKRVFIPVNPNLRADFEGSKVIAAENADPRVELAEGTTRRFLSWHHEVKENWSKDADLLPWTIEVEKSVSADMNMSSVNTRTAEREWGLEVKYTGEASFPFGKAKTEYGAHYNNKVIEKTESVVGQATGKKFTLKKKLGPYNILPGSGCILIKNFYCPNARKGSITAFGKTLEFFKPTGDPVVDERYVVFRDKGKYDRFLEKVQKASKHRPCLLREEDADR